MNTIASTVKKTSKQIAIDAARKLAQEPVEILRDIPDQILGIERKVESKPQQNSQGGGENLKDLDAKDRQKAKRISSALTAEMEDIRRQNIFDELQKKVSRGELVTQAEMSPLTYSERDMLVGQMEMIKMQNQNASRGTILTEPPSKRRRGLFSGMKTRLSRMERKTENRMPPSG